MQRTKLFAGLFVIAALLGAQFDDSASASDDMKFTVRIENISSPDGQTASNGAKWPFALSPGMWVVYDKDMRLFKDGKPATGGLEMQAEDGNPEGLIKMLESEHHTGHGVFNTPVGASGPAPIRPGGVYEFTLTANRGMKLTIVTMFGQSNDWFYANEKGIELFDRTGKPVSGDFTSRFALYDAGTEKDQEPGVGADQAPRQKSANTGEAENGVVHKAKDSTFYTKTGQLFRVTITPVGVM
ncbi:MAG: spondin domain-containing protein [Acidobacteriota bacterium]